MKRSLFLFGSLAVCAAAAETVVTNSVLADANIYRKTGTLSLSGSPSEPAGDVGYIILDPYGRGSEGVMLLDVERMQNVKSAVLHLFVSQSPCTSAFGQHRPILLSVMENTAWDETTACWNLFKDEFDNIPGAVLDADDPKLAAKIRGREVLDETYIAFDITRAVRERAAIDGRLSLRIYCPFQSANVNNNDQCQILQSRQSNPSTNPVRDPKPPLFVVTYAGDGPDGAPPARAPSAAFTPVVTRRPVNAATISAMEGRTDIPIGTDSNGDRVVAAWADNARQTFFAFDTRGLGNVASARLRFRVTRDVNDDTSQRTRYLRVSAFPAPPWDAQRLTWNTAFEHDLFWNRPDAPSSYNFPNQVGSLTFSGPGADMSFEAEATEAVRTAAARGQPVTFALAQVCGTAGEAAKYFCVGGENTANAPVLIVTEDAAGFVVSAEPVEREDGKYPLALKVTWTEPASVDVTYTVARAEDGAAVWTTLAEGLTARAFTDLEAWPGKTYTYRVTATAGAAERTATVTHTFSPDKRYEPVADTYLKGGSANASVAHGDEQVITLQCNHIAPMDGVITFDLSELPADAGKIEAVLHLSAIGTGLTATDQKPRLDIRYFAVDAFKTKLDGWTEENCVTWADMYGADDSTASAPAGYANRGWSSANAGHLEPVDSFQNLPAIIAAGGRVKKDFTNIVKAARDRGERYLHVCLIIYNQDYNAVTRLVNVYSRNAIYDAETRPHLRVTLKPWSKPGMLLVVR